MTDGSYAPARSPIIEVDNLTRRFGNLTAVNGILFNVFQGELFGFLGPNGAGKTTTLSMLNTLLKPTAGSARLAGFDTVKQPNEVRRTIGVIFQDPSLDDRLTALDNMRLHAFLYRVPGKVRESRIQGLLEMVGLASRQKDIVKTFSGGMKRRLEIARGLLHVPKILFLDEPTVGLDPQTRKAIWRYLTELRRVRGITIFLTTHYMEEAEGCDRVGVIDEGKIIALDTPAAIKARYGKSLEDAFITMTGHEMRDEEGGAGDANKLIIRAWRKK